MEDVLKATKALKLEEDEKFKEINEKNKEMVQEIIKQKQGISKESKEKVE